MRKMLLAGCAVLAFASAAHAEPNKSEGPEGEALYDCSDASYHACMKFIDKNGGLYWSVGGRIQLNEVMLRRFCREENLKSHFGYGQGDVLCPGFVATIDPPDLLQSMNDVEKWAIDGQCHVPSKTYVVDYNAEANNITWQDGLGNIYVEHIIYDKKHELRTVTIGPRQKGAGWIYTALDKEAHSAIRVTKPGKTFTIVSCPMVEGGL